MQTKNNIAAGEQADFSFDIPALSAGETCCTVKWTAVCGEETIAGEKEVCLQSSSTMSARGVFWAQPENGEYEILWEATPSIADVGMSAEQWFNEQEWTNGVPIVTSVDNGSAVIALAPDGTPAVQVDIAVNQVSGLNYRGHQLTPSSTYLDVVHSLETWTQSTTANSYYGFGHHWWSNGTQVSSGGSNNPNGGTVRGVIAGSGNDATYIYGCDNTGFGATHVASHPHIYDKWVLNEMEVRLNNPASEANGYIQQLVDCETIKEVTDYRLRCLDDVYHKGTASFVRHNAGAPAPQSYWLKNYKIYAR